MSQYDINFMKTESDIMGIETMTEGISSKGMLDYIEKLKVELLTATAEKINNTERLEAAINSGWQGKSRDEFLKKFNTARLAINEDLKNEFDDLVSRLIELQKNYFEQDKNMIEE